MKRIFSRAMLALPLASATVAAQQPPTAPGVEQTSTGYTVRVTSTLVSLDVVVTDARGNPVDNLTRDDFHILDDGKPQTIQSFEAPEVHFFPQAVSVDSTLQLDRDAPNAPVTILVLDEANTRFEDEAFARYSIEKYLATQPEHLTQPTQLAVIDINHYTVLRDYTTSKSEILDALHHHLAAYPWHLKAGWQSEQYAQSFKALQQVARAVAGHPGHKNMIWIGRGMPSVDLNTMDPDDVEAVEAAIQSCVNLLRDSRVTLYTIDPTGVAVEGNEDVNGLTTDSDPFGSSVDFNAMAQATGGRALFGRNDVDHLIDQSVRDGNHFYTLTYRPPYDERPRTYRSIRVSVNRPGLTVTTREGYYVRPAEPPPPRTVQEADADAGRDLLLAAENQMVYDGLPFEVRLDSKNPERFLLHIPAAAADWSLDADGKTTASLSLLAATFDRRGRLLHHEAKDIKVHSSSGGKSDPAINLATTVDTAGAARVRFVVRNNANGRIGAQNLVCKDGACKPL